MIIFSFAVHCQNVTSPIMGDVVIISNGTRSTAVYSCQSGYHVHGNMEVVCTDVGLWDFSPPVCRKTWNIILIIIELRHEISNNLIF